jgi:hypothetical protein
VSFIDELATSHSGSLVAYSPRGMPRVQVWSLSDLALTHQFDSILEPGGWRLAISEVGLVVAAAFRGLGVEAYDGGRTAWRRRDLKRVQVVRFGNRCRNVWAIPASGSAAVLDARTGETLRRVTRVAAAFPNSQGESTLLYWKKTLRLQSGARVEWHRAFPAPPLDALFLDNLLLVSHAASGLVAIDPRSGHVLFSALPSAPANWTCLGFNAAMPNDVTLVRYPLEPLGTMMLDRLDVTTGQVAPVCELSSPQYRFCLDGRQLIGSNGDLRLSQSGDVFAHLPWATHS